MKLYTYKACGSCQKALKFLAAHNIEATVVPIRETPPTPDEIRFMISHYKGDFKPLFNTSGMDYRSLQIKDKLSTYTTDDVVALLSTNGNLIKRPFVITPTKGWVGFKLAQWCENLNLPLTSA